MRSNRTPRSIAPVATLAALAALAPACRRPSTPPPGAAAPGVAAAAAAPPPHPGGFADVTEWAGIDFRHRLPGADLDNIVDSLGGGAALSDLDGDGWLDLVVVGGSVSPAADGPGPGPAGIRLYRNLGQGRFADRTEGSGLPARASAVAVAAADVDGDGDRDLYLVDRGANRLFLNRGDLRFHAAAGADDDRFGVGAAFFDMEGDGDLDLYVANYLEYDPRRTPFYRPDGFPGPLAYPSEAGVLYRNDGHGGFTEVTAEAGLGGLDGRGMSVLPADLDEDGDQDLFVANDASPNFLLLNDGAGRFHDGALLAGVALGQNGDSTAAMAADLGDVDGDGHADLAVSDTAFGSLYRRHAPGLYGDVIMDSGIAPLRGEAPSWGQNLLDFDNDGDLDLFVARGGLHHLTPWEPLLLENDGAGRFHDARERAGPPFASPIVGRASVTGDVDNDGDLDVFVTVLAGPARLFRNDAGPDSSWLTLDLVGRRARDPFGASVEVWAGGRLRRAEYRFPSTYLGQSDPRLHFGLGPGVEIVERIRVTWPGGQASELREVPARQIVRIDEDRT